MAVAGAKVKMHRRGYLPEVQSEEVSNDHYVVGSAWSIGWRHDMEDAHAVHLGLRGHSSSALIAVFDGHGGKQVARHCAEKVHATLLAAEAFQDPHPSECDLEASLRQTIAPLDEQSLASCPEYMGTTATLALVVDQRLAVAWLGDSRGMLARDGAAHVLTVDHKPGDAREMERITAAGGFVIFGRIGGQLNLSRALGDAVFKDNSELPPAKQQVSSEPDVCSVQLNPQTDHWLLLACDGVWNSMSEGEVLEFVYSRAEAGDTPGTIAEALCNQCNQPSRSAQDNVTAVLVWFKDPQGGSPSRALRNGGGGATAAAAGGAAPAAACDGVAAPSPAGVVAPSSVAAGAGGAALGSGSVTVQDVVAGAAS